MSDWLNEGSISSNEWLSFSRQIEIIDVGGPYRHFLWRHRGWRVQVAVLSHENGSMDLYYQNFESWLFAFVKATYYRMMYYYHNFKYRRYHRHA